MDEVSVNVLTLNCWAIPFISRDRRARISAIAEKCASREYDIVSLQEVWSINDFKIIRNKVREVLPYSHYFYSGVFGSGVCILSRFPIQDVIFHKWPLNGYFHKIHHADWYGGKGVGLCKLKIHNMNINIYVTHLHAEYNRENDEYMAHRVSQAFDTAQYIRMTSGGTDAVILAGDLNIEPQDLAYRIICGAAGLTDACPSNMSHIGTNESANNSYTNARLAEIRPDGKRIDHILYLGSKNVKVEITNFQHPLPNRVPGTNFSYSDHEAVMATFKFTSGKHDANNFDITDSLKEGVEICETAIKNVQRQRYCYLLLICILVIPLICSIGLNYMNIYIGLDIGLNIIRIFLTIILCYILFMSLIWNRLEQNALKAVCLDMKTFLTQLNKDTNQSCMLSAHNDIFLKEELK